MKTNLLTTVAASMLFACASTADITKTTVQENTISAKEYVETCEPTERYFVRQFNAKVFRHTNDCLDIDDLLTVVWTTEMTPQSIQGAKLMAIAYAAHLTRQQVDTSSYVMLLATDTFHHEGMNYHICFFHLRHKKETPDAS